MTFKDYISEGIIVPTKIKITTTDIKKLNKIFKDTIIEFDYDTGEHGAYLPQFNKIVIYITKETPFSIIEALIQHEIIHSIQDKKSGMRMNKTIQTEFQSMQDLMDEVDDLDDDDEIDSYILVDLMKKYNDLHTKAKYLNDEERMTYAYMFVKLRRNDDFKKVINKANEDWYKWTKQKMNKKMMKYFYSYWMVKDSL